MKRRTRRSGLPFELGDLERYGMLALAAALVLGVACLLHAVHGNPPPFRSVAFASDRIAGPVDIPERPPGALARSGGLPAAEPRRVDAPGGGEQAAAPAPAPAPAPAAAEKPKRAAPRPDFDFFEPPVRVAGRPAPLAPPAPGVSS